MQGASPQSGASHGVISLRLTIIDGRAPRPRSANTAPTSGVRASAPFTRKALLNSGAVRDTMSGRSPVSPMRPAALTRQSRRPAFRSVTPCPSSNARAGQISTCLLRRRPALAPTPPGLSCPGRPAAAARRLRPPRPPLAALPAPSDAGRPRESTTRTIRPVSGLSGSRSTGPPVGFGLRTPPGSATSRTGQV